MASVYTRNSTTLQGSTSLRPANAPLYRRLLLPHLPPSSPPPPLLVSASPEVNEELYDFLALALRAYITPWWSKITRYDREFVPQVAAVVTEIIRSLEVRVVSADIPMLLLRVLPTVLSQHYIDYRLATEKLGSSYTLGGGASLHHIFHSMQAHIAIDAEGQIDPEYFRRVFDHILAKTLPSQDNESEAERTIIREIIVKVLLQDVTPLLTQPWFIHRLLLDRLRDGTNVVPPSSKSTELAAQTSQSQGLSNIVVSFLSAIQYLSGLSVRIINGYKHLRDTIHVVNASANPRGLERRDYAICLVQTGADIFTLRDRSASNAILALFLFAAGFFGAFLNKFLTYVLLISMLTEHQLYIIINTAKTTLFPNGYPGPPPVIPTAEEQALIKEQLILQAEGCIPSWIGSAVLGPGPTQRQTIIDALAPLSSPQCNAHLVLFLFDAIVVALFPELGVAVGDKGDASGTGAVALARDGSSQESTRTRESVDEDGEDTTGSRVSPLASPSLG